MKAGEKRKAVHFDGSPSYGSDDECLDQAPNCEPNHCNLSPNTRTNDLPRISLIQTDTMNKRGEHDLTGSTTSPSSYATSKQQTISPSQISTAATSLNSRDLSRTVLFVETVKHKRLKTRYPFLNDRRSVPCETLNTAYSVSIITSEKVAAVKIYLESYFALALSTHNSQRTLRRKQYEQQLAQIPLMDNQRRKAWECWERNESHHLRHLRALKISSSSRRKIKDIGIDGYEVVQMLGKGSFGIVRLVIEKQKHSSLPNHDASNSASHSQTSGLLPSQKPPTKKENKQSSPNKLLAMKIIRKSTMLRSCQEAHLRAERDFLIASEGSPWVVPLVAAFQDNTNLYLVMEYMVGGDFLGYLSREDILTEEVARWYIAEMIVCIEQLHMLKVIHRDVKPDNFLIHSSGHLKISDFGLAFDGHWTHSQAYYQSHRYSLLERLGLRVTGDAEDQIGEKHSQILYAKSSKTIYKANGPKIDQSHKSNVYQPDRRRLARSIVGTSQYMAPEVIEAQPYDGRCD